jgi:hypothetical protein
VWPPEDEEENVYSNPMSGFESTVESILDPTVGGQPEEEEGG